jgi:cytoskeletal protein CcmA (bactofilin family)
VGTVLWKKKSEEDEAPPAASESSKTIAESASKPKPLTQGASMTAKPNPTPNSPAMAQPSASVEPIRRPVVEAPGLPRRDTRPIAPPSEGKRLIVGRDISLSGEISSCDKLIVEGRVQANVSDCHEISIAQTGAFKGNAEIDGAEISGQFQGTLTVHDRLLIRSTGRVDGEVRYGRLEIECGGELTGQVTSMGPPKQPRVIGSGTPAIAIGESGRSDGS